MRKVKLKYSIREKLIQLGEELLDLELGSLNRASIAQAMLSKNHIE